jgi:hypothetical protein
MGKGNLAEKAVQAVATFAVFAATATPGFAPAAVAGQSPIMQQAANAVAICMNNNGWNGGATLAATWQAALPNPAQRQTAASCISAAYTQLSHPTDVMKFMNANPGIGAIAHKGPIAANSNWATQGYGAGYSGSAVPGCTLRSAYDPELNQKLKKLYDRCVLAHATAETTRAESGALAEQKKYECILNQNEVNALIAQENKRINVGNTAKSLFTLITAGGSAAAFATKNDELGLTLALTSVGTVVLFPKRQMIQTGNYEQCAIIKRNLAATNGL